MRRILNACALAAGLSLSLPAFANGPAAPPAPVQADGRPVIEVTFVLDTTGSMGGLLESAKQKIWSIASRMASGKPTPRIRVGLVAYRDLGDAYVTKHFDLSEDLDAVYGNLRGFQADGGGDTPEHVGKGLADAVSKMSWSQGGKVSKLIFLVGDAPAARHNDGFDPQTWTKRAIEKGIVVNTIRCGGDPMTEAEFRTLARLADGSFVSIAQDGGAVAVATPHDATVASLSAALASKTLMGGSVAARGESKRAMEAVADMPAPAAADRVAFKMKAEPASGYGAGPKGGAVDLAAAPAKLAELKESELPDELKGLSAEERRAKVEAVAKERKALEAKLTAAAKERDAWLAKNASTKKDSFDEQVFESVKAAAKKVGVAY